MVEPLTAVLKEIDGKPVTLLRTASGKTVAAVYDEDYINRFLEAARKSPSTEINKPYRISSLDSDYQDSAYFMDSPTGKRL